MQSTNQFNSSTAAVVPEQRDDTNEFKSVGAIGDYASSREQPNERYSSFANPNQQLPAVSNGLQTFQSMREHWSKRLRGSDSSPTHEGYSCEDIENDVSNSHVSSMIHKIKQIQAPKVFTDGRSSLSNDLVRDRASHQNTIGNLPRKQILSIIQSKSDMIANEGVRITNQSWNAIVERAEVGRNILAEREEVKKISAKLAPMFIKKEDGSCYHEATKSHTREVSFDYQLMSDVDYSSAPRTSIVNQ